ncbi:lytic transglycosylase domain-containing protein [Mangrovibrevibacter kandeliae]|uniref:lytic transglycosylase domain-containing protein n=1 Tax=Mangrovibrevibacter kandeliae TaxID=2968473 RepID=UPI0021179A59|nr:MULTISPECIES: lytic transglycosylase domain-containing protein [unclassified Aurantimonas]MCQ8781125.1 lytic transglycosylase domain-containing protein [Aurantimonas sp. CSK15Z-1]MCW4113905.1 lytic transglycosylase domain-containing protein [Aurantimonas sp. MSK8Z-1]
MAAAATLTRAIGSAVLSSLLATAALADSMLPPVGPMPRLRPGITGSGVQIDPSRFGGPVPTQNPLLPKAPSVDSTPSPYTAAITASTARLADIRPIDGKLKDGLDALTRGDVDKARAIREGMLPGSLDRHILAWAVALHGGKDVPSFEIAQTASELRAWPGMKTLRANSERALYREQPPARAVLAAFGQSQPETAEGAMVLARAMIEAGDVGHAKALIQKVWRTDTLDSGMEAKILDQFGTLLTRADHKYRMDWLLYRDRVADAKRSAGRAGAEALFAARAAAIRGEKTTPQLLAAVPSAQRSDPGYLLAQVEYARKVGNVDDAAAILLKAPRDRTTLIDPDAWWNERRIISRDLIDQGEPKLAYKVAAAHSAETPSDAAEAEFHAGWYALRFLNDPSTAAKHFSRIAEFSSRPMSASRAYYWLGRAAEAGGPGNARSYYGRAASYGTTYYGQLAAARLGARPGDIEYPKPTDAERRRFEQREAVRAIKRLQDIDYDSRANIIYRDLADELDSPGELALLAVMAEQNDNHYMALKVGKQAAYRGVDAPALAFPIGVIPADARISAAGKALAYAIARQESEFNPGARSPVGALGLLQLMPGTAKNVASKAGMPYSLARLTSDPGYNATLGSHYLGQQIDDFDGSYILTFIAYNAGPRRAREWVERFGDPRGKSLDEVVDWVERIPFTETRNYVQRVMENYQVYKIRLGAPFSIEQDLRFGRRS